MGGMQIIQAILLGLTQGLTEFIPVSSSGHLILVGNFLNFEYSGLAFDTAMDIGTLAALFLFFWRDFWSLGHDLFFGGELRRLAVYIMIATIPAVVIGVLVEKAAETVFRSNILVAFNLIWVALIMLLADRSSQIVTKIQNMKLKQALIIGFAQCLALVPGVSRSGSTIIAGRLLKLDRVTATRFSFLLSAPVILGATLKLVLKGSTIHDMTTAPTLYIAGILAALVSGYLSIRFLIDYLGKHGLALFAYYRIGLGVLILVMAIR
jgi:undecaprenyl-diphosphatase